MLLLLAGDRVGRHPTREATSVLLCWDRRSEACGLPSRCLAEAKFLQETIANHVALVGNFTVVFIRDDTEVPPRPDRSSDRTVTSSDP